MDNRPLEQRDTELADHLTGELMVLDKYKFVDKALMHEIILDALTVMNG